MEEENQNDTNASRGESGQGYCTKNNKILPNPLNSEPKVPHFLYLLFTILSKERSHSE